MRRRSARKSAAAGAAPVLSAKIHLAGIGFDQAEQDARERGLAAAGFTDNTESFTGCEGKADPIDADRACGRTRGIAFGAMQQIASEGVGFFQVANFEKGFGGHVRFFRRI